MRDVTPAAAGRRHQPHRGDADPLPRPTNPDASPQAVTGEVHPEACESAHPVDVVPLWYYAVMAMNLRLDDEDSALLKALAEAEHVSLHEAALRAIRRSARELAHTDRVREATAEMLDRWGEVLDRLGNA